MTLSHRQLREGAEDSLHSDARPIPDMGVALPAVDYRRDPNHGQTAGAERYTPVSYAAPNPAGVHHVELPQPDLGHRGYSLNPMDAPPNRMVPGGAAEQLPYGHTPFSPGQGAWAHDIPRD